MSRPIAELKSITPELRRDMLTAEISLHYIAETLDSRDAAIVFISSILTPIKMIQTGFDLPSGKLVKVQRKV